MQAKRMFVHGLAVATLATMCMAQARPGSQSPESQQQQGSSMEKPGQMGMGNTPNNPSEETTAKTPDHMFITKAAQGGMAEVELGKLASQNGANDGVKQFGSRMVTDHSQANDELKQLAQKKGITLPSNLTMKDKRTSKMLGSKQGSEFDKAYIHDMVRDHEADVAEFRKEAENGKDPDVKAWAQKTLPVLEQHLAQAKQLAGQVGAASSKPSAMSTKEK